MAIAFACKCGKRLQAPNEHAERRVQCPKCGRALVVPRPEVERAESSWRVDASPRAAEKADQVGVVRQGQAGVLLLQSAGALGGSLTVEGAFTCWYCQTEIPFAGQVFGREGLAGAFVNMACPKCKARIWTGFSTHQTGEGTDVYLYAPSTLRGQVGADAEATPAFAIHRVAPASTPPPGARAVNALLFDLVRGVSLKEPYAAVSGLAARLVGQPMARPQHDAVCEALRALLEKEPATHLRAILAEALASLRDERAARFVQAAFHRSLKEEDPADASNLPLHDLAVLALLFGDGNGFLEAAHVGLQTVTARTRACKLGRRLTPREVAELIQQGDSLFSYEATLGGTNWQYLHPLLPLWVDEPSEEEKKGWLNRLFGA